MASKRFILKRQTVAVGAANPYRPRGQMTYGPLMRVGLFASLAEAQAAVTKGLYRHVITHGGRKVWESQ